MDLTRLSTPQRVSAIAIIVVAIAAFLPWVAVFGISVAGIRGDGVITLIFAVIGGLVLAARAGFLGSISFTGKASLIVSTVLAGLTALIGMIDMNGAAAIGLYLTLFGGIAWVVGAVWELVASKEAVADPEAPTQP